MDLRQVESKWQKIWADTGLYKFNRDRVDKKWYVLEMFSYPSGAKLHAGHWYNYGPADSYARFKRMQGYEVFQPMGFDAFGLPAENYAIKTGIHPHDSTMKNIATMEEQLKKIGAMYDWDYEVCTCLPEYYKWTQWLFLQLYKHGLAYRKAAPVNWCPSCNTVLANEQVIQGECERCGSTVVRKNLTQWFFKITDYADELLEGLDKLDWPEKTKLMQKNWIGKSYGGEIEFAVKGREEKFRVFTTRADTAFGVTYVVLAPENPLVDVITTPECKAAVEEYKYNASKVTEIDRLASNREKTGVMTGAYAINPVNGREVPILVADYVLASYGTGAVMGVAAHDERDYVFAKKLGLPIERVVKSADGSPDGLPYTDYGVMVNSGEFDGMSSEEGKIAVIKKLEKEGKGALKTNYRLRDWLVSRQRYWGAPIPMIHCEHCGVVPVPEEDLPVRLPYNVDFTPDGVSPLAKCEEFMNVKCPVCGRPARRDPDTLDTFVCSSWYYLRYPDNKNDKEAFDRKWIDKMLPVDKYIGGAEHACMHLLYARFFTKALRDMGYLDFDEPFLSLVHQGTILGSDGNKMSKSRGNVVSPDDSIAKYGADVFRVYLMFGFSYVEGGPWNENGLDSIGRFFDRVERAVKKCYEVEFEDRAPEKAEKELNYVRNATIKAVSADIETFSFNTALARIMEFVNAIYAYDAAVSKKSALFKDCVKDLVLLLAPFAPHFSEELWEMLGQPYSVFNQRYPVADEKALVRDEVELAVQVNSKLRARITVPAGAERGEIESAAREAVKAQLGGAEPKKIIIVPGRLVNLIV
ncbi:MAG TPA: leucine--tRNA ligase [Candidatus Limadaptatus stercorigallinarum]|uniref:Leucine--tRNA ligase n=1 Tax=Candidatus Limadaptatus stercorigallinarum TaxID=2840845 RepID=A0A9D1HRE6_9FIRM|nr:leucine--tRNA ligase [Candidatus Limadaptatus stercorigallinarum]